jgi:DNA polymerase III epsilon subunit-like protein
MSRYIVFDTETPNSRNDSICSIGITVVENGAIVEDRYDLVDPEARFDVFNVELHGISPDMVRFEKNFPVLWEEIEPIMNSGILVAHNAPFDLGVLGKLFRRYGIARSGDDYVCTVQLGRKCIPNAPNHKLNTLCDLLNISLDHHNAASDSHACAELLCYYLSQEFPVKQYIKRWEYGKQSRRYW